MLPGLADREQFLVILSHQYLPGILAVIFLGALISAILSTVDSIILACPALLSHNFLLPILGIKKEKTRVLISRGTVIAIGLIALIIALSGSRIYDLVLLAAAFGTAGVLVITLFGLYSRLNSQKAALLTLVGGLILTPAFQLGLNLKAPFLLSVLSCVVIFVFSAGLSRKKPAEIYLSSTASINQETAQKTRRDIR